MRCYKVKRVFPKDHQILLIEFDNAQIKAYNARLLLQRGSFSLFQDSAAFYGAVKLGSGGYAVFPQSGH
jgi:hypothetical protein